MVNLIPLNIRICFKFPNSLSKWSKSSPKGQIALQLENGGRVIGEYSSEDTLDKMLEKAQNKLEGNIPNGHEPVVIYMRKEIGKKQPKNMTSTYLLV